MNERFTRSSGWPVAALHGGPSGSTARSFVRAACVLAALPVLLAAVVGVAIAQEPGTLRAGASRVNVTPADGAGFLMAGYGGRTQGFTGIRDSLYYRVLVLDDGRTQGALVVGDLIATPEEWWQEISARIEREAGIPPSHVFLSATHTHGGPQFVYRVQEQGENLRAYTDEMADAVVGAVLSAQAALRPARIGTGRGRANVNVNRTARTAGGAHWLGQNPDGPSDKTVHVVRIDDLDGRPIAVLANYAVHAVIGGQENLLITADLPGETSRLVEKHFGDGVVAPWTSGAAGDQNPIYWGFENLDSGRIRPLDALGRILAEEVIRVAENVDRMTDRAVIRGAQKVVSLPGKEPNPWSDSGNYTFMDADPVDVRLSVLLVNNIAFCGVAGEVLTGIGQRLKRDSPFSDTMMITHTNGAVGYLADDKAYETPGYEIMVTRVKEGAEEAIVEGLLDLMYEL